MGAKEIRPGIMILFSLPLPACSRDGTGPSDGDDNGDEPPSWSITTVESGYPNVGLGNDIALDPQGGVHISYCDNDGAFKYATNVSGSWQVETIPTGGPGRNTSIAVDPGSQVHIARDFCELLYVTGSLGSWQADTIDTGAVNNIALALDQGGHAHVSFMNGGMLRYGTNLSGTWELQDVEDAGSGYGSSIVVDLYDRVHICYSTYSDIRLATYDPGRGSWTLSTIGAGWYPSVAADLDGKLHVGYYDFEDEYQMYTSDASGSWETVIVDTSDLVDSGCATAADLDGNPHLVYGYVSYNGVMYATDV
jgi:hypothetical protein